MTAARHRSSSVVSPAQILALEQVEPLTEPLASAATVRGQALTLEEIVALGTA